MPPGSVFRVNTGGPLPEGSDAVIMVEDTRLISSYKDSDGNLEGEENEIETLVQVPEKENIRFPGTDVRVGDIVLQKGDIIKSGGGEVGTLAFVGMKEVRVTNDTLDGMDRPFFSCSRLRCIESLLWLF